MRSSACRVLSRKHAAARVCGCRGQSELTSLAECTSPFFRVCGGQYELSCLDKCIFALFELYKFSLGFEILADNPFTY